MALQKMLFPVDLSGVSPKILPTVLEMAGKLQAELHVVHVATTLEEYAGMYGAAPVFTDVEDRIMGAAEKQLRDFDQKFLKDYPDKKTVLLRGEPDEEILKYIESEKIDLVIMGTHGRKGLDRVLFGSVADHIVKNSPVPVITVNPHR